MATRLMLLGNTDIIVKGDWCRPLYLSTMNGGHSDDYSFKSQYSGAPQNNTKWCRVERIMPFWIGTTVGVYNKKKWKNSMNGNLFVANCQAHISMKMLKRQITRLLTTGTEKKMNTEIKFWLQIAFAASAFLFAIFVTAILASIFNNLPV